MNSQCEQIEPLMIDHALGELDRSKSEAVEQHLKSCPRCSEALEQVRQIVSGLWQHGMVEPSPAVSDAVREAVRDKVFGRRKAVAVAAELAGSFVRRPVLAGASATVAIAVMTLLLVLPSPPTQKERSGERPGIGQRGKVLKVLGDYLRESQEFLELTSGANAGKALSMYDRDDCKQLIGQAMDMKKDDDLMEYEPLLADLEGFYRKVLSCDGKFGEKELGEIRQLLDDAMLSERVDKAIESWR